MSAQHDIVIIAADGSEQSNKAFKWYQEKLHKKKDKVIIVSAFEAPSVPTRDTWDKFVEHGSKKRAEMEALYTQKLHDAGISGSFVSDFEKPGPFLCSVAKEKEATYIVMGTRGLGSLRRTIMGSVSDYVVHHAHCPVLVYKT